MELLELADFAEDRLPGGFEHELTQPGGGGGGGGGTGDFAQKEDTSLPNL